MQKSGQNQEYIMTREELRRLQMVQLEMLIEFDRICRENQITYSLDGGTLLGAVRHQGFIPWDNDIDVVMLRKEYLKFREACKGQLDGKRFFLQDYTTDPDYRWGYAKIRRKGTEFVRLGQEHLKQKSGVFIDIFAVDNVPDHFLARRVHHFACVLIRKALYSPVGAVESKYFFARFIYKMLSFIPRDAVFGARDVLAERADRKETELIDYYVLKNPKRYRYGLPRRCFDQMEDMVFEGRQFSCFKDYHTYLCLMYGDYMKLPPEKDRVSPLKLSAVRLIDVDI